MNAIATPLVQSDAPVRGPAPPEPATHRELAAQLRITLVELLLPVLADLAASGRAESQVRAALHAEAEQHCHPPAGMFTPAERLAIVEQAVADLVGYGPLEELWRDETISEIVLNGVSEAHVARQGRLQWIDPPLADEAGLQRLVQLLLARAGTSPTVGPLIEARLPDGSHLTVVRWPHAVHGTVVSLRRGGWRPFSAQELLNQGAAAPEMLEFLAACIQARLNIVVCGAPGSGITPLLGLLARSFGRDERVVTVEDSAELRLQQPHWVALEARVGGPPASVRDLLDAALRMRPDRLVLGACHGPETADLVHAMAGGLDGVLTTVHAQTPRDALNRLESLVLKTEPQAPPRLVRQDLAAGVQIIVQMAAWQRGLVRRIVAISEVAAFEGELITLQDLFRYEPSAARAGSGLFVCCGNRAHCDPLLLRAGVLLPGGFFDRRVLEARR